MDDKDDLALVGPGELAELLGVSRSTVDRLRRSGELPAPRLMAGRLPRWRRVELVRWWREQPERERRDAEAR